MRRVVVAALATLMLAGAVHAGSARDEKKLVALLKEFLAGAAVNDTTAHHKFWADDLVYTGSTGRRVGKADIMRDLRSAPPPSPDDPKISYGAEDIRVQQYGGIAVVTFRLVATTVHGDTTQVANFLNSGTFLERSGRWQVVNWQATRMPKPEPPATPAPPTEDPKR